MRTEDGESGGKVTTLFIATTARILKIVIFGKGQGHPPKTVEDSGCGVGCMTVDSKTGDIVVARDDAIYYYTLEGRGAPRAYECPKSLISTYGDYLALVSPPTNSASSGGQPDSMRRRFGASPADTIFNASTFSFLETDLKIVAHTQSVISSVQALFQVWGDMYMLTSDGKVSSPGSKTTPWHGLPLLTPAHRSPGTMRSRYNKDWKCCINATSIFLPLNWRKSQTWMRDNRTSYFASLVTICTKRAITTVP